MPRRLPRNTPLGIMHEKEQPPARGLPVYVAKIENVTCDRAPGCPVARVCPRHAVVGLPGGPYPGANGWVVDEALCTGCGVCVRACPTMSVSMNPRASANV